MYEFTCRLRNYKGSILDAASYVCENKMFGINEILDKLITKKELTEEEKFKVLRSKRINPKVIKYLMDKLNNLHIEVLGEYEGSLFELMSTGKLEGWCWQTTESAIQPRQHPFPHK